MHSRTADVTAPVEVGSDSATKPGSECDVLYSIFEGQRPLAGGARMALRGVREVRLGRGPSFGAKREGSVLVVTVPDERVSTRHARLVAEGSGWVLVDEGSRNGTYVEHARIVAEAREPLALGTTFSVGASLFVLGCARLPEDETLLLGATLPGRGQGLRSLVPAVAEGLGRLAKIAASDLPVLLLGESGTGKEVLAQATHALSPRSEGPFVAVNSGALTQTLLEAQLFGHVKGAFSGAIKDEPGYFRSASGGTLFLDEIGDLPEGAQAVLLRALETSEVTPVGATRPVRVDVRVVSATLKPVSALREDLRMRLAGYTHSLVPLRDRLPDLGLVVGELLPRVAGARAAKVRFAPEAVRALGTHPWRLNVRELLQALKSAIVLAGEAAIVRGADLPAGLGVSSPDPIVREASEKSASAAVSTKGASASAPKAAVPADERKRTLLALLAEHQGNLSEVARKMQTTRVQVHRWLEKFAIDVESFRRDPKDDV